MSFISGNRHVRMSAACFAAAAVAVGGSATLFAAQVGSASSHREAPLITGDPKADNTDVYAFVSPDSPDKTTLIANWIPFEEPAGGPNFYTFADDARYNINIDNNGDAEPDITYRWTFQTSDMRGTDTFLYNNGPVTSLDDQNLLVRETYTLQKVSGGKTQTLLKNAPVAPSNVGKASMPDYASLRQRAVSQVGSGGFSFAGQADDPFFLDLRVFDLLYGGDLSETGADTLSGYNVNSIALQVPTSEVTQGNDPVVGVWSTTERRTMRMQKADGTQSSSGQWVQVSRLGNPLVNEVVVPAGLKDAFNALPPVKDATVKPVVNRVNDPEVPQADRVDLRHSGPQGPPQGPLLDLPHRRERAEQAPGLGPPRGDAAAEHLDPADLDAEPARGAGQGQRRVPQRTPLERRRGRHRAAGAGGRGAHWQDRAAAGQG